MKYRQRPAHRPPPLPPPAAPTSGIIDLHVHSRYSDGDETPEAIVARAREAGASALALTDHDSVRGVPEAAAACREAGIVFVPGVELGVGLGSDEIHLLGYGIDARSRSLQRALERLAGERFDRMERMVGALQRLGVSISLEEVQAAAGGEILGRLHLATALVGSGAAADRDEAFRRWIGSGRPAYVRRSMLSLREAIDLVREAGGVCVMAHPGLTRRDEIIEYLVRLGVRGLEVYHPRHDFVDVARYRKACQRFDLVAVGGSDYHGPSKPDTPIGKAVTPPEEFAKLLSHIRIQ